MSNHIDPVCGMEVQESPNKYNSVINGTTYFFCSQECQDEFNADPEEYIGDWEEE